MFLFISYSWILLISAYAAWTDVRTRTISNPLILFGFMGLITWQVIHLNLNWESLMIGILLSLTLWGFKFIGGGDSKLLMLVSSNFEINQLLILYVCIFLVGAGQALWWIFSKKETDMPYAVSIFLGLLIYFVLK